jgi:hypothetical protein
MLLPLILVDPLTLGEHRDSTASQHYDRSESWAGGLLVAEEALS